MRKFVRVVDEPLRRDGAAGNLVFPESALFAVAGNSINLRVKANTMAKCAEGKMKEPLVCEREPR